LLDHPTPWIDVALAAATVGALLFMIWALLFMLWAVSG
jgi:hypothetical protein